MSNPAIEPSAVAPRNRWQRLSDWLVHTLPNGFDRALQSWGQGQLLWLVLFLLLLAVPLIITPLKIWQQTLVAIFLIAIGWVVVRLDNRQNDPVASEYLHLFMVWLSLITTFRYLYYRTAYTLNFDGWINSFFCLLLYCAEVYAVLGLMLAYFQTLKLKDRQPIPLDTYPPDQWFKVDIYIPTYNEDIEIVRKTALAAIALNYPAEKKHVYVLDDGRKYPERRQELQRMCDEVGCTMLTRDNNDHAKAGNINTALKRTGGDLVMILDCDHIPVRNFLQETVGFFYNPNVMLVQTPHWFYNPDPFERNLLTKGRVPVSNELFYKIVQKGNDFWNAAFFCGSAAVIRKEHVLQIGGIAVETVTEDCHTSFRLHSLGYESVYYDRIMVAGLAPEKFSALVGQQVRWARGMAQILRIENPLFSRKLNLSVPQRLCYFSAMFGFFYGLPRIVYAIAPPLFLLFGINPIRGLGLEILMYALPHIVLSMDTNYITSKRVRFSFWNEVFEFALSFYTAAVTLMALINPKMGSFNVTDKGLSVTKRSFDWESARALLVVTGLVIASLIVVPFWLVLSPESYEAVLVNALWSGFNLFLLLGALLVAYEQPQLRRAHRLNRELPVVIYSQEKTWKGQTIDISETGARIVLNTWPNIPDVVDLELVGDYGARAFLTAQVVRGIPLNETQTLLIVDFLEPTQAQMDTLALVLYSDVKEWYSQNRQQVDDPLESLRFILGSLSRSFAEPSPMQGSKVRKQVQTPIELFWEGHRYSARVVEAASQSLCAVIDAAAMPNWDVMQRKKPIVGLQLAGLPRGIPEAESVDRLLAFVDTVEVKPAPIDVNANWVVVELRLPKRLQERQKQAIQHLLNS
ncbi:MAG: UDP-forming cellulose synthase catalytic subunit [Scytolyngbya sp. HA4215-MV1]|jgi:cellulose synthase (UDP-forming)|nr:UDP-forming cellulose synthase catalytic subunit [Scytolyngbya sp. HA4215-MV1]